MCYITKATNNLVIFPHNDSVMVICSHENWNMHKRVHLEFVIGSLDILYWKLYQFHKIFKKWYFLILYVQDFIVRK